MRTAAGHDGVQPVLERLGLKLRKVDTRTDRGVHVLGVDFQAVHPFEIHVQASLESCARLWSPERDRWGVPDLVAPGNPDHLLNLLGRCRQNDDVGSRPQGFRLGIDKGPVLVPVSLPDFRIPADVLRPDNGFQRFVDLLGYHHNPPFPYRDACSTCVMSKHRIGRLPFSAVLVNASLQ